MPFGTIRPPTDSEKVSTEIGTAPRPWMNFFRLIARVLENLRAGTTTITTVDVTPAAAATADGVASTVNVGSTTLTSLTSPLITSPDATNLATAQTLANELKADVNTMVTNQNTDITLTNELKADVNQLVTDFNALVTQFDALVTQVNVMNTQLTANIALTNELKAAHNEQVDAINE